MSTFNTSTIMSLVLTFVCCIGSVFGQNEDLLASVSEEYKVEQERISNTNSTKTEFKKKYHYLVARAYFKLLAQSQRTDNKLKGELNWYLAKNERENLQDDTDFQEKIALANKKLNINRRMLFGLRSWNLFSKNKTGDMFYFMAENELQIFQMYSNNAEGDEIIKYLMYKLADVYHFEEQYREARSSEE